MTACGSWAELRRDVLLYAEQVYTGYGSDDWRPPKHQAYVEPKPRVFLQVAEMADELKLQLSRSRVANEHTLKGCEMLARTSRDLARIAQKELDGVELDENDVESCRGIGSQFRDITNEIRRAGPMNDAPSETRLETRPEPMPVVADVATDPNQGRVLEVAVGNPCRLYVLIPFYGRTYAAVGACFSYYEFSKPATKRMTDEEWRAIRRKPPMPEWTRSLVRR
jgi:hypothetical protein